MAPIRGVLDCFHFAGNGGLTVVVTGPSVPKHNNNKKDYAVLLSDSTSRSNLQLSSLDVLLGFVLIVTFCVPPLFSFAAGEEL